ncbi:MSMEG_0570 family nitrogen starvation response protein [Hansschlegelia sp. KR7-227]|uniref:MSMEG_0570 family nitrogen starvation response protein n=1 Tax=Hansschlegelia sp. KR7-227 TaxID=3400914 RepID=UPI003C0EB52C
MPEMRFLIRWPDGAPESCYSPSLVVRDHMAPGESYPLDDFLARARTALTIASARVEAKYGRPCGLALGQLARIEAKAASFADAPDPRVAIDAFED